MISQQEIRNLVGEWQLRDAVIEKDYVLGWVLWGIGSEPALRDAWAFKGGTALKKCYIETWRFSEDLDFTVIPGGPETPETIALAMERVLARVNAESGIDFSVRSPAYKHFDEHCYTEGRIYYRGPCNSRNPASIKLDISGCEKLACPTVMRPIAHSYSDAMPEPAQVRCYAFEEVFAEKLRAMGERGRPRDLYDIILLYRRWDRSVPAASIREALTAKCASKGVPVPTHDTLQNAPTRAELASEWDNMLRHQLQTLPPLQDFLDELPNLFDWLEEKAQPAAPAALPMGNAEDAGWRAPATVTSWNVGLPLESMRFAAANHLCVKLGYGGTVRLVEPYSLRRSKEGNLLFYAVKVETGETRGYRVDRIESITVTEQTFRPRYAIEMASIGQIPRRAGEMAGIQAKPRRKAYAAATGSGTKFVFQCGLCGKKFTRASYDPQLHAHKDKMGFTCPNRQGILITQR